MTTAPTAPPAHPQMKAVLRVEYQELPEGMIRETKVVMEDANEGER